jgi:hypothetical protein
MGFVLASLTLVKRDCIEEAPKVKGVRRECGWVSPFPKVPSTAGQTDKPLAKDYRGKNLRSKDLKQFYKNITF